MIVNQWLRKGVATPAGPGQSRQINGLRWKDRATDGFCGQ
jgi:hypothetical protein